MPDEAAYFSPYDALTSHCTCGINITYVNPLNLQEYVGDKPSEMDKEKLETAKKMILMGFDNNTITQITALSLADLQALRQQMS